MVSRQELTLKYQSTEEEPELGPGAGLPVVGAGVAGVLEICSVHTGRVVTRRGNWKGDINYQPTKRNLLLILQKLVGKIYKFSSSWR